MNVLLLSMLLVAVEEVDVTAGAVTSIDCAIAARDKKDLSLISTCPLSDAQKQIVVFDVAEQRIFVISKKKVHRYELEKAFAGGSIDMTGNVVTVDKKTGVATIDVDEYIITPRPKPGAFKGCL